jgi:hypothetical protein
MRWFITVLVLLLFPSVTCIASPAPELVEFFSFEQDFEGWMPESILVAGSTASITRSQDRAIDGQTSLKLAVRGIGEVPTAAVWIQRGFTLAPGETYQVQLRYFLATADGLRAIGTPTGTVVAATNSPPANLDEVFLLFHEFVVSDRSPRYRWLRKQYEFTAQTDDEGTLSVIIGVMASGIDTNYYIDGVRIKFTRRQAGAVQPVIKSASFSGKRLTIQGSAFGPSPRVIINDIDRSDLIVVSSDSSITLRGGAAALGLTGPGHGGIRVVDDTTAAASAPFDP